VLTYEKFVSGYSGSRYKYGEKFPYRHTIMGLFEGSSVFYLLLLLPTNVIAHDCTTIETKYYLESQLRRDVSWVRHDASGTCSVQFSDSAG